MMNKSVTIEQYKKMLVNNGKDWQNESSAASETSMKSGGIKS
jgi:hypothetical protein